MKLIYCTICHDIVKLRKTTRTCDCGASAGRYHVDGINAAIWGDAVPLGITETSLVRAMTNRPEEGLGEQFIAFVIPKKCDTIKEERTCRDDQVKVTSDSPRT